MQRLLAVVLVAFPRALVAQPVPPTHQVMRVIAEHRAADSVPSRATIQYCLKQRAKQAPRPLTSYCRIVLEGRLPADTTIWFVASKEDEAARFASISKHPFMTRSDFRVTCPSEQHPRGPGIGYFTSIRLRWARADSVHAFIRWECSEPAENRTITPHSHYYRVEEYHVMNRSGRWIVVPGMISVT